MKRHKELQEIPPTAAPAFRKPVLRAIQSIAAYGNKSGEGPNQPPPPSPQDCKIALDWIIYEASLYYEVNFAKGDPSGRADAFFNGRRFVGKQIIMATQIKPELGED
jgi:hypothetical protein